MNNTAPKTGSNMFGATVHLEYDKIVHSFLYQNGCFCFEY